MSGDLTGHAEGPAWRRLFAWTIFPTTMLGSFVAMLTLELHRWHHSRSLDDANKNYGANLIVWDIVFGTRHLPSDREHQPADVGFDGVDAFPSNYLGQVASVFRWSEIASKVDAAAAEAER